MQPPGNGGGGGGRGEERIYIFGPGHMTKLSAIPIYVKKTLKIFFSKIAGPIALTLGM